VETLSRSPRQLRQDHFRAFIYARMLSVVAHHLRRYHERQLVTSLILEMLERGMTTEDIARVLSAADLQDQQDELFAWQQRLGGRLRQKLGRRSGPEPPSPKPKP